MVGIQSQSFRGAAGTLVYAIGAVWLGAIGLWWRDFADYWQPIQAFGDVPHRKLLACIAAAGFVFGGMALLSRVAARSGIAILGSLYLIFSVFWLPRVLSYPQIYGTWGGFFEEFALVSAAIVLWATREGENSPHITLARVGQRLFGLCAISFALEHFTALAQTAAMVPKWIPPNQTFWAIVTGIAHLLAGLAIISGIAEVLAAHLLTIMLLLFGLLIWLPRLFTTPRDHISWAGNAINLVLAASAWVIADFTRKSHHNRKE
jgi:uncharacterized membrane protein YphA (DoxX/SURF4 family)